MLVYASLPRRPLLLLLVLVIMLAAGLPAAHEQAVAAGELTATPATLALSLPFGSSARRTITLTNATSSAQSLTILEAQAALPAARLPAPVPAPRPVALPAQQARFDPRLLAELGARPETPAQFAIYLHDQADLAPAYQVRGWAARGRWVYQALRDHAERSQRGLRAALDARGLAYQPLWIVNAIVVRGRLADAQALAARADVALLRADRVSTLPPAPAASIAADARCSPDDPANLLCWNIRRVAAERVWRDFGVNGQGVVVANIDTGVRFDHPALRAQYRGYQGGAGDVHDYNWFDPKQLNRVPTDPNGHGTHTMGTMVAAGSDVRPAVGVAPGARWIAAQGCGGSECSEFDLIAAAQWMLAPTTLAGRDPRPDLRPMIINNSWSSAGGDGWYAGYTAAWRAAGIFPVFAAGNTGSACGSIGSPGDYADVLAAGATDQRDQIAAFSARGPTEDGRLKPDLVAPGGSPGILSAGPGAGDDYRALQGTSMAAPHVAGVVALLWAATPSLVGDYAATMALLQASAQPTSDNSCGAAGARNNVYGAGRVDAYAAVQRSRPDVPWLTLVAPPSQIAAGGSAGLELLLDAAHTPGPGVYQARVLIYTAPTAEPLEVDITLTVTATAAAVVSGRVISADTGAPVQATIAAAGGQQGLAGQDGRFSMLLPLGEHALAISAPGFLARQYQVSLSGDQLLGTIVLDPDYPQIAVAAPPLVADLRFGSSASFPITVTNQGPRTLHYQARVWPDQFAAWRSDEPGGPSYAWVSLPSSAKVVQLGELRFADAIPLGFEFPYYNYTFTETLVAEDGFVAFALPPGSYTTPTTGCFPDTSFSFYAIAPFRSDIDISLGGRIRYATVDRGHTFVVSYEDVHLSSDESGAAYTFQLLLRSDGRIVYQYQSVPRPPAQLAVGVQRTQLDYQQLGCGSAAAVQAGLAIELRPQPSARQWLTLAITGGSVAPGSSQVISATLGWVLPRSPVQRGRLEIISDDPIRTSIVLPAQLAPRAPPWRFWLPVISQPLRY